MYLLHGTPIIFVCFFLVYKIKNEYTSESDSEKARKMADLGARKYEGIGPTTKDGMPLILRSVRFDYYLSIYLMR